MTHRLKTFQKKLVTESIDAAFISKKTNLFYLVGLSALHPTEREAYLFVTQTHAILYHSPFITVSESTKKLVTAIPMSASFPLEKMLTAYGADTTVMGVEKLDLTVAELERLQKILPQMSTVAVDKIVTDLRKSKDTHEINSIKKACEVTAKVMEWVQKFTTSPQAQGVTEKELARKIEQKGYEWGSDGLAFPTIVAFNAHTASPHHASDDTKLTSDSVVLVDMGVQVDGYMSDMTRTWSLSPTPHFLEIEKIVKAAHAKALSVIPNYENLTNPDDLTIRRSNDLTILVKDVDLAARKVISDAGYGDTFIHTTGHGLGVETHEAPSVNANNQDLLEPGMVITIEPGIYLNGKFGYRHEDTILIT